ncbi:RNA pseudouridine synthase [Cystobacter fuscus]|uniref:RNA pseudouridine synthase n=1 Tax=Cystobacter fuscus TaxID=43 RepID=A0A250IUG1_9BACT|nr:RluA family pseudouridine synthase [Cystobacter fuscus]ATB34791.1 RNA pseudouridine synthase [Cystobacter fuscus]
MVGRDGTFRSGTSDVSDDSVSDADVPRAVTFFEGPLAPGDVPSRLASPFDPGPPGRLARRSAEALQQRLHQERARWEALWRPGGGKMFGVLVVATPGGRIGSLCAFSGMLEGAWNVEGFVPPLFDAAAREAFWPEGEAELAALEQRHAQALHEASRESRMAARRECEARLAEIAHLRAERSRELWRRMAHCYVISNARGERLSLAALFAPQPPPGGAGDCAAPKLLAFAYRHHLKPLALAEFWWGASPLKGARQSGAYYPACDGKCGKVLPYMLEGLPVEPGPPRPVAILEDPRVLHEDPWLLVIDKPHGLPCVPGRHSPARDSVLVRLQRRFPELSRSFFVHPLEPESSGLVLLARDSATQASLQRQFARREAEHRHVAWVDGRLGGEHGSVELALRGTSTGSLEVLADGLHGKRAVTEWRVCGASDARTRVVLWPRTWHPLQLRIHTAHPLGLGVPLVGDVRFGREDTRLMLHAEGLGFTHPRTGVRLDLDAPAPF